MKVTVKNTQKSISLNVVPVGQCVRQKDSYGIYMRQRNTHPQAPEWVRLNEGDQYYTRDLERFSGWELADAEVVVHG